VISPLIANAFLHEVFDVWFHDQVLPRMHDDAFAVRYADDLAVVFKDKRDAERVHAVIHKRFGRFGLTLHPEKTRLEQTTMPSSNFKRRDQPAGYRPGTLSFLGFTLYWAKARRGNRVIKSKTAAKSLRRAIRRVWIWCREHRHMPLAAQQQSLSKQMRGHYAYFGVWGNSQQPRRFYEKVVAAWRRWLCRRSDSAKRTWRWINGVYRRHPLPAPVIHHRF